MGYICTAILLLSVFVTVFMVSHADLCKERNPCRCTLTTNGSVIDLSTIGNDNNIPQFFYVPYIIKDEVSKSTIEGLYSYNPCYDFTLALPVKTTGSELPCKNAAACKIKPGTPNGTLPESYAIGLHKTALFYDDQGTFHINYITAEKGLSNLTVHLFCDESVEYDLIVDSVEEYNHKLNLTSKCACPDVCKPKDPVTPAEHGLSTGSVLLITFFTILLVYVFLGIAWNFCNGAQGIELLPNIKFWTDVPQLVVDGFLFTCSRCMKRSPSSYTDM